MWDASVAVLRGAKLLIHTEVNFGSMSYSDFKCSSAARLFLLLETRRRSLRRSCMRRCNDVSRDALVVAEKEDKSDMIRDSEDCASAGGE